MTLFKFQDAINSKSCTTPYLILIWIYEPLNLPYLVKVVGIVFLKKEDTNLHKTNMVQYPKLQHHTLF